MYVKLRTTPLEETPKGFTHIGHVIPRDKIEARDLVVDDRGYYYRVMNTGALDYLETAAVERAIRRAKSGEKLVPPLRSNAAAPKPIKPRLNGQIPASARTYSIRATRDTIETLRNIGGGSLSAGCKFAADYFYLLNNA